jgi:hypothetical protein
MDKVFRNKDTTGKEEKEKRKITQYCARLLDRWGSVASGDMSRRLIKLHAPHLSEHYIIESSVGNCTFLVFSSILGEEKVYFQ